MALTVQDILFIHLLVAGSYPSSAEHNTVWTNEFNKYGKCWLRNCTIGATFTRTGNCSRFSLKYVNITDSSEEQLDRITDGLIKLAMEAVNLVSMSLPTNLIYFDLYGMSGYVSPNVTIDANSTYKIESFMLYNLPQIPANIEQLHSLKSFTSFNVDGRKIDFIEFSKMLQLEKIFIKGSAGVILPDGLKLPSLRKLTITGALITVSDVAFCKFPKLDNFAVDNNNLQEIPAFDFSTFTNVQYFCISSNKLRRVNLDIFANMSLLRELDLSYNQISQITSQSRIEFPNLLKLSLLNNNLTELNFTQWISMPTLKELGLSGNQLKRVPGLLSLAKLEVLVMDDNPWDCEWLVETVVQIPGMKIFNQNGSCYARSYILWSN